MGLDSGEIRTTRLVIASISGYGTTGPARTGPRLDQVVQRTSRLLSVTRRPRSPSSAPAYPRRPRGIAVVADERLPDVSLGAWVPGVTSACAGQGPGPSHSNISEWLRPGWIERSSTRHSSVN